MAVSSLFHIGKHRLITSSIVLIFLIWSAQTQGVQAATIDLDASCAVDGANGLAQAIGNANTNDEDDTINLNGSCTYVLSATLNIGADGGHSLTINGNGATISGNNAVRVFNIAFGANVTLNGLTITQGLNGIYNEGTLTISNSTFSGNSAVYGGGIVNDEGTLTINNSTVSGNSADFGGGIYNYEGTLTINNSTVSDNRASRSGGGIVNDEGTLTISNSIIANNTGGDCIGTINHTGPNYGCGGSVTGNLNLGPFTGGYFPLLSGSVAIDAGDDSICPSTDQRGAARPLDGNGDGTATCDLGSYEVDEVVATATPTVTPTETPLGTPPPTDTPAPTAEVVPTVPPPPPTPLCEDHNFAEGGVVRASIADSLGYAVNCRVLYQNGAPTQWLGGDLYNAGAIGIQGVLDLGVIQAVDIFSPVGMSYFNGGAVFCLRGQGTLIWLAAKNAPRVAEVIGSYEVDDFPGFTCATLFEPGTLVLVRDNPTQSMPPLPAAPQRQTLTNCTVTFDIGVISSSLSGIRAELPATAFVDGGYQVSLNGVEVWLSADLVTTSGDCGE